ncbi:MAG: radical SAM protein [Microgenomates group bacterium]
MKPKILIIDTPFNLASENDPPRIYLSFAAMYLMTALRRAGYNPVFYDPKVSGKKNKLKGIFYVGDTFAEIEKRIRRESPDIVAVTNLFSKDFNNAVEVCRRAKRVNNKIVTVVGGPHATALPKDFLAEKEVDIVAIGEGEETIVELMRYLEGRMKVSDIKGIAYRKKSGSSIFNEPRPNIKDMDQVGFPDFSGVDLTEYFSINARGLGPRPLGTGKRPFSVETSRGCPYQCFFCAARNVAGLRFRPISAGEVLRHIKELVDNYGVDYVSFEDDNISFDPRRFEKIVDGLLSYKKKLLWGTPNGVRADTILDKRLLRKVKESGCQYLTVGVESGNQDFLSTVVNKSLDLNVIKKLAKMCAEVDLPLNAFFIIGFPDEKLSQIRDTLGFAFDLYRSYGLYPFVNFAIPIRGTKMYDICKEKGYLVENITSKSLAESSSFRGKGKITTPEFTPEILSSLMKEFNGKIFRNSLWRAIKSPRVAFRYATYAIKNFSHFKRYVFG